MDAIAYNIETEECLLKCFEHFESMNFVWGGSKTSVEKMYDMKRYHKELPLVIHIEKDNKHIYRSSLSYSRANMIPIVTQYPWENSIKPEFHSDFKRMFRVNRVPLELSSEQVEKLTQEKVLELWKIN